MEPKQRRTYGNNKVMIKAYVTQEHFAHLQQLSQTTGWTISRLINLATDFMMTNKVKMLNPASIIDIKPSPSRTQRPSFNADDYSSTVLKLKGDSHHG